MPQVQQSVHVGVGKVPKELLDFLSCAAISSTESAVRLKIGAAGRQGQRHNNCQEIHCCRCTTLLGDRQAVMQQQRLRHRP